MALDRRIERLKPEDILYESFMTGKAPDATGMKMLRSTCELNAIWQKSGWSSYNAKNMERRFPVLYDFKTATAEETLVKEHASDLIPYESLEWDEDVRSLCRKAPSLNATALALRFPVYRKEPVTYRFSGTLPSGFTFNDWTPSMILTILKPYFARILCRMVDEQGKESYTTLMPVVLAENGKQAVPLIRKRIKEFFRFEWNGKPIYSEPLLRAIGLSDRDIGVLLGKEGYGMHIKSIMPLDDFEVVELRSYGKICDLFPRSSELFYKKNDSWTYFQPFLLDCHCENDLGLAFSILFAPELGFMQTTPFRTGREVFANFAI